MAVEKKEFKHPPPRKHLLLLSCMDARLLDQVVAFMDAENLTNRYDQVVFAGAAMGVMHLASPSHDGDAATASEWKHVFFHHLQVAIDVLKRPIKDVWILEHRDCGAFEHFHPTHNDRYEDDPKEQALEEKHHAEQAFLLAGEIREFCKQREASHTDALKAAAWEDIRVSSFLMDLRGHVKHLKEKQ